MNENVEPMAKAGSEQIEAMIRDLTEDEKIAFVERSLSGLNDACMAILTGRVDPLGQARVMGLMTGYAGLTMALMARARGGLSESGKPRDVAKAIYDLDQRVRRAMQ